MNLIYAYAPTASLIFFFCVFLLVAYYAYRPSAKKIHETHAHIPLMEERRDR